MKMKPEAAALLARIEEQLALMGTDLYTVRSLVTAAGIVEEAEYYEEDKGSRADDVQ
jgi:hypothetical protein